MNAQLQPDRVDFPAEVETITVGKHQFEVRQLTVDELMPLLDENTGTDEDRTHRIVEAAVRWNGNRVRVGSLPMSVFGPVSETVARVNGLDAFKGGDDSGNV